VTGTGGAGTGGVPSTGAVSGSGAASSTGGTTSLPPGELHGFYPSTVTETEVKGYYDAWKTTWVETCTDGTARVKWDNAAQTVSEGIGYGMLLAASWDDRTLFDGLWAYYSKYKNSNGMMAWLVNGCDGTVADKGSATDADLDAAMALLIADCKWPDAGFGDSATTIINAIRNLLMKTDGSHTFLCAGDGWGADCCGNASYQAPAYYRAFGVHTGDATFWSKAADDTYYYLDANDNDSTGLVSDWMDPDSLKCDAKGWGDWHGFDASRMPWRVATDYAWWGSDLAKAHAVTVSNFIDTKGGISATCQGYNLAGTSSCTSPAITTFAGPFATAAIANSQALSDEFFQDLKGVNHNGYFNEILRALSFTLAVGRFNYCGE
jgi:endo-1,4-beta-D-glucanase Y